jgi:hypothetical protein
MVVVAGHITVKRKQRSDIAKRTGKNPAKSAVARKILIACWHILSRQQPFKPARSQTSGATDASASSRCFLAA